MSEVVAGSSIQVPDAAKLENYANLPKDEQEEILKQVADMQNVTAETLLQSNQGYDVLKELYRTSAQMILSTSTFIVPVAKDLDGICQHLSDPQAFTQGYKTLLGDIKQYREDLGTLWECHQDKTGAPAMDEVTDVFSLAEGYSKLAYRFERAIEPLMSSLAGVIEKEYLPVLEEQLNADA